jgi:hypothetical protein
MIAIAGITKGNRGWFVGDGGDLLRVAVPGAGSMVEFSGQIHQG